jgi:hypothetical protein
VPKGTRPRCYTPSGPLPAQGDARHDGIQVKWIAEATVEEIFAAVDDRESLERVLPGRDKKGVWQLDPMEYGNLMIVNPSRDHPPDRVWRAGRVWRDQADSGDVRAALELSKVADLIADLRSDGAFRRRPLIKDVTAEPTLEDGRHRFLAAHHVGAQIEVYWIMPPEAVPRPMAFGPAMRA